MTNPLKVVLRGMAPTALALAAWIGLSAVSQVRADLQAEIDTFLKQEERFGRFEKPEAQPAAAPAAPAPEVAALPEPVEGQAQPASEAAPVEAEVAPAPEAVQPAAAPAVPSSDDIKIRNLETMLEERTQALAAARDEIDRLKGVIKRIWDAGKQDRLNSHYNMGCVYRAYRQYKAAEAEFLKALSIDPNDAGTHYNLAILYDDDLKDKAKARQHYRQFLELAPDDKDAARVREWLATMP